MKNLTIGLLTAITITGCGDYTESKIDPSGSGKTKRIISEVNPYDNNKKFEVNQGEFKVEKLIQNIGLNIVYPESDNLLKNIIVLNEETKKYCKAIQKNNDNDEMLLGLQSYWKEAMRSFHRLEILKFGPLEEFEYNLSDKLYSWPLSNYCGIDGELAKLQKNPTKYKLRKNNNRKGLDALEYLLFSDINKHECKNPNTRIKNYLETTSKKEKKLTRCTYISSVTEDLIKNANELKTLWNPQGHNYTERMVQGNEFSNIQEAINSITDSFFFIDKVIKETKLERPLNLGDHYCQDSCAEDVEHTHSNLGLFALRENLNSLKKVFIGEYNYGTLNLNGHGLDDFLKLKKGESVATRMSANIDRAIQTTDKLMKGPNLKTIIKQVNHEDCLDSTSENRKVEVCSLYHDIKAITDDLKGDFLIYLSLQAPRQSQSDND